MTRKEAITILETLRTAGDELEAQLDIRDWPDELCEAFDTASGIAQKYAKAKA